MKNRSGELIVSQSEQVHLAICVEASQICRYRRAKYEFWQSNRRFGFRLPTR